MERYYLQLLLSQVFSLDLLQWIWYYCCLWMVVINGVSVCKLVFPTYINHYIWIFYCHIPYCVSWSHLYYICTKKTWMWKIHPCFLNTWILSQYTWMWKGIAINDIYTKKIVCLGAHKYYKAMGIWSRPRQGIYLTTLRRIKSWVYYSVH